MPSHLWGDENFDWKALDEASWYIQKRCKQFARMGIWVKEKYGTLRVSTTCAYFTEYDFIHSIFYPGHAFYRLPDWFRIYIDWPLGKLMAKLGVIRLINKYQLAVLRYFWKRAAKKWPHISEEILDEYEWIVGDDA